MRLLAFVEYEARIPRSVCMHNFRFGQGFKLRLDKDVPAPGPDLALPLPRKDRGCQGAMLLPKIPLPTSYPKMMQVAFLAISALAFPAFKHPSPQLQTGRCLHPAGSSNLLSPIQLQLRTSLRAEPDSEQAAACLEDLDPKPDPDVPPVTLPSDRPRRGPAKRRRTRKAERIGQSRQQDRRTKAQDKLGRRQQNVIDREFDRTLVLEEFVDETTTSTAPPDEQSSSGVDDQLSEPREDAPGQQIPSNLRYDPTFELPIPSEATLSLSDTVGERTGTSRDTKDKPLPSLADLSKQMKKSSTRKRQEATPAVPSGRGSIEEYSLSSGILGEGQPVFGIGLPYLQSCHTVILLVTLLCAFVEYPGFPLTNLPLEYREALKQGLLIAIVINGVLAVNAAIEARKREQSVVFWAIKCFFLGGLAHNELLLIRERR